MERTHIFSIFLFALCEFFRTLNMQNTLHDVTQAQTHTIEIISLVRQFASKTWKNNSKRKERKKPVKCFRVNLFGCKCDFSKVYFWHQGPESLCCRFERKNLTKICSYASLSAVVCFLVFFGVEHFVDLVSYPQNIWVGFMTQSQSLLRIDWLY